MWGCSGSGGALTPGGTGAAPFGVSRIPPTRWKIHQYADLVQYGSSYYSPLAIAAGPGRLIWVVDSTDLDFGENVVVGIGTNGDQIHTYFYPGTSTGAAFQDITVGPDGALWLTDDNNEQIVRLTIAGHYSKFPLRVDPINITTGPDKAIWFTAQEGAGNKIGRMTTRGHVTIYDVPREAWDVAPGSDGAVWFTEPFNRRVGRITPRGSLTEYTAGITGNPYSIAAGPDGALWFTEASPGRGEIGRITTAGNVTEYATGITPAEEPSAIAAGRDGAMWFTEEKTFNSGAQIARISMHGRINEYSGGLDPTSEPTDITAGPDGRMWFVEAQTNETGRVRL